MLIKLNTKAKMHNKGKHRLRKTVIFCARNRTKTAILLHCVAGVKNIKFMLSNCFGDYERNKISF